MAIFTIMCLVFSAVFSALSIVRGATAHIAHHKKAFESFELDGRIKASTKLLSVAWFMMMVSLSIGYMSGQNFWTLSNKFVIGLWLVALVFRTRLTICRQLS